MYFMKKMAMHERVSLVSAEEEQMSTRYNAMLEEHAARQLREFALEAEQVLAQHRAQVELLAAELIARETLDLKQIKAALNIQ